MNIGRIKEYTEIREILSGTHAEHWRDDVTRLEFSSEEDLDMILSLMLKVPFRSRTITPGSMFDSF